MCCLMHHVLFAVSVAACVFGIACCFLWLCVVFFCCACLYLCCLCCALCCAALACSVMYFCDFMASGGQLGRLWVPKMKVLGPFLEALK